MFSLFFFLTALFVFLSLNNLLKRTNWFKNKFIYSEQIQSSKTGLDIINLGSNPALFGFDLTKYNGQNWSTGTQAPDMDFEILKNNVHRLKKGAHVLIPVVPFSSVSTYLDHNKPMFQGVSYYSKFAKLMPHLKNRENRCYHNPSFA